MEIDLNKMPAVEDDFPTVEVQERALEDAGTKISSARNGNQRGNGTGVEDHIGPLPCPWQAHTPAECEFLYNTVHVPANYHPVHRVFTHRANIGTSEHAWMSWLPTQHAYPGGTVIYSAFEWINLPSIFTPSLARHGLASRAPGRVVPDHVNSAFSDPRRLWSTGGLQQVEPSQTTTDVAENHGGSDRDEGHSLQSANNHQKGNSKMEGRSSVRLVEPDRVSQHGAKHGVPVPPLNVQNQQDIDGSTSQIAVVENHDGDENTAEAEDIRSGAELLDHLLRHETKKKREADFLAAFNFTTERCNPTAPCSRCLKFCKTPLPQELDVESSGSFQGAFSDHDRPPVLKSMEAEEVAKRKESRHGPKSKSSEYRGVTYYKRTQRWESHVWHDGKQVYLGASATKEEAARSYDRATLMLHGLDIDINFEPTSYQTELSYLYKLNKNQLVSYLRRESRGFGAQATYPGVKHVKNHYQAVYKGILCGTFSTEEGAARVIYKTAVKDGCGKVASSIINTHHVRNMPSFAAQRYAAIYPEEVEANHLLRKKRSRSRSTKAQQPSSSQSAAASPNPVEQLPAPEINEIILPCAKRTRRTWRQHQESTQAESDRNPPAATTVAPPASSSRGACNTTSSGVGRRS